MKIPVALFAALASILVSSTVSEYVLKVRPPIPPPPPPHFKYSPILKGGGHRWSSNSLGPPRFHHHFHPPSGEPVHHHHPHRPTITVHHHANPLPQLVKPQVHVHHAPTHHHAVPHPGKGLVHHHHHHHLPSGSVRRPPHPAFQGPWKGPVGLSFGGLSSGKDTFHPSPPDSQLPPVVATHQSVDDNKGPIHTIPAPNLGPSGKHHPHHGFSGGGNPDSGFQTSHGIGQGNEEGGPYPNPVYGKPATADLTYHEPKVPAHVEAEAGLDPHIPTITIQSSHGYQVHEQLIDATPAPISIGHHGAGGIYFAPDPDPSIPAPKVPFTTDPHSHPSNGQSPPDLEQEIPQHLLAVYGVQPQLQLDEGGGDLGGRLLLAQALAQYDAQTQPEAFQQLTVHRPAQVSLDPGRGPSSSGVSVQQAPLVASLHETIYPVSHPGSVSDGHGGQLSMYELFANSPVQSPVLEAIRGDFLPKYLPSTPAPSAILSADDIFRYAGQFQSTTPAPPVRQFHSSSLSPVPLSALDAFDYQQQQQFASSTVAPPVPLSGSNDLFGYQQQQFVSSTAAPPVPLSGSNAHFGYQQQQFASTAAAPPVPLSGSNSHFGYQQQQFASTTAAPPVPLSGSNSHFGYQQQQQFASTAAAPPVPLSGSNSHFGYQQQQFASTTAAPPIEFSAPDAHYGYQQQQFASTIAPPPVAPSESHTKYQQQQLSFTTAAPQEVPSALDNVFAFQQQGHAYDVVTPTAVTELYHNLGATYLNNHRAQGVSVSNPGQVGYIAASYHHQQQSSNEAPTAIGITRHDSSASETSDESKLVTTAVGGKASGGYSGNQLEGTPRKETVRPSSSSFYTESGSEEEQRAPPSGHEEDYYENPQEVDDSRRPETHLSSEYENYAKGNQQSSAEEEERREQEYDSAEYEEYEDGENSSTRQGEDNYDRGIEFGTRLKPKRTERMQKGLWSP